MPGLRIALRDIHCLVTKCTIYLLEDCISVQELWAEIKEHIEGIGTDMPPVRFVKEVYKIAFMPP